MIRRLILSSAMASLGLASVVPAAAQESNRFAIGINYTRRLTNDELAGAHSGVGIKWRLGHSKPGWGPQIGLGWFAADVDRVVGGRSVPLAELKVRPIVGGYGYTHDVSPKVHITADVVGGFAFTSLELRDTVRDVDADLSWIVPTVRPEVSLWYDIHRKLGVSIGAGYTFARPKLTLTSAAGRSDARLRADTFSVSAGLVYRVF